MLPIAQEDGTNVVFINSKAREQDRSKAFITFIMLNNGSMDLQWDLGIRNERGKEKRMGAAAFRTSDTADAEAKGLVSRLDRTHIRTISYKTGTASTRTFQLVDGKGTDGLIIKILGKGVAEFMLNGYHSNVRVASATGVYGQGRGFGRRGSCLFYVTKKYDNTKKAQVSNNLTENTSDCFESGLYLFWRKNRK